MSLITLPDDAQFTVTIGKNMPIFVHIPKCAGNTLFHWGCGYFGYFGHLSVWHLKQILPSEVFDTAYFFTIVRNPYDRFLSAYSFLKNATSEEENVVWHSIWGQTYEKKWVQPFETFEQCVLSLQYNTALIGQLHFKPQFHFLWMPPGRLHVSKIVKLEELPQNWEVLRDIVKTNKEIPMVRNNKSEHPPWREVYTPLMRSIIAKHYATDFQVFGYDPNL